MGDEEDDWLREAEQIYRLRRDREEISSGAFLGTDEWAYYDEEEEIDALLTWLNAKGVRELALKNALTRWKGYIIAGALQRKADSAAVEVVQQVPEATRRSARKQDALDANRPYMHYRNKMAKY